MIILSILQCRMSINFAASTILLSTPRSCLQSPRTEFFTRVPSRRVPSCAGGDTNSTLHAGIQQLQIAEDRRGDPQKIRVRYMPKHMSDNPYVMKKH